MLSQKKIKLIQSLQNKKFRQKYNLFFVEGKKSVEEIVKSEFKWKEIFSTEPIDYAPYTLISTQDLKKISALKTPQGVLALVEIPENQSPLLNINCIALDAIQDPGNLGTIIRTADWFGISQIVASPSTVDLFNPKVIQATMGSFTRVSVIYQDLQPFLQTFEGKFYAADMNGTSIFQLKPQQPFCLIMGNEGNGISQEWIDNSEVIAIPNYSRNKQAESLNVSIATAILLAHLVHL